MKEISLTNSPLKPIIDDEDFERVSKYKWYESYNGYVGGCVGHCIVYLHRFILNIKKHDKVEVDHIDKNKLNNCKCNLRNCSSSQNSSNKKKYKQTGSKYKGVFYDKRYSNPWRAYITVEKKRIYLGNFSTEINAATAYNNAALKYHKEFAVINIF